MFLDPDRRRPLTYRVLLAQFKAALERVGYDGPPLGLHGVRVEGYNLSKAANGEDLTAVHGLWMGPKAGGHGRYNRFDLLDVANIPTRMMDEEDVYAPNPRPRRIRRGDGQASFGTASNVVAAVEDGEAVAAEGSGSGSEEAPVGLPVETVIDVEAVEVIEVRSDSSEEEQPGLPQFLSPPAFTMRSPPVSARTRNHSTQPGPQSSPSWRQMIGAVSGGRGGRGSRRGRGSSTRGASSGTA